MISPNHSHDSDSFETTLVAIGSSAGGIEALREILPGILPGNNLAAVILQHHDPDHYHLLMTILEESSNCPVTIIEEGETIQPDRIYIPPANKNVSIDHDIFRLQAIPDQQATAPSIDLFMISLSKAKQFRGIGIILSGNGSDGACGIRELKSVGGIIIAQTPQSAKFQDMPRTALATGCVDLVLEPQQIETELSEISKNGLQLITEVDLETSSDEIDRILGLLYERTGCDFSDYKLTTINRRIGRRMSLNKMVDLKIYADHLNSSDDEINLLFKDLLISVTSFFRDPDAFGSLEKVFQSIIEHRQDSDKTIRIWVPGCATGEEVYSIAITLARVLGDQIGKFKIQIFATDVDPSAVAMARKGIYPKAALAGINDTLLKQYIVQNNGLFQLSEAIRNMIIFSHHDLLKDPPFSRIDLISCRNVLIYFNTHLQKRVMSIFHYALNANGYLFLGKSESGSQISDLFVPVDTRQKIFQRRSVYRRPPIHVQNRRTIGYAKTDAMGMERKSDFSAKETLENLLLKLYGHSSVLVNDHMDIIYVHGDVSPFLGFSPGTADLNILSLAKGNLGIDLRIIINKSLRENKVVHSNPIAMPDTNGGRLVRLTASPVPAIAGEERLIMVVFERIPEVFKSVIKPVVVESVSDQELRIAELDQELTATKEYLQTTIEELENTNQDLLSLNEELQSTNEELQSTNEELETSNEEMQAANEELITLNEELEIKTNELARANASIKENENRLRTLYESIPVGIGVSREDGMILAFNDAYEKLFGYTAEELRGINAVRLYKNSLERHAIVTSIKNKKSIQNLEVELVRKNGNTFTANLTVAPFAFNGTTALLAVIQDITDRKKADADLKNSQSALKEAQRIAHLGSWEWQVGSESIIWSEEVFRIFGLTPFSFTPTFAAILKFVHAEDRDQVALALEEAQLKGTPFCLEYRIVTHTSVLRTIQVIGATDRETNGTVNRIFGTVQDITERKRAEDEKIHLEKQLQQAHKMEAIGTLAGGIAHDFNNILTIIMANTELILANPDVNENTQTHLEQINIASLRARDLIQQLLNYSRKSDLLQKPINMATVVKESLRFLRASIPKSIDITENIMDSTGTIVADPTQIHQVMLNLCSNAADAMQETGGSLSVELAAVYLDGEQMERYPGLNPGPHIRLCVKDTGSGIPLDIQKRIFEPFYTTKETGKGTGMGLAMVHGIVKNHMGHINVQSRLGIGTLFEILLPKMDIQEEAPQVIIKPMPKGDNEHILYIDDEDMVLSVGTKILRSLGYKVTPISSGTEAIEVLAAAPQDFDIVITDYTMPKITGLELAKKLSTIRNNIPILLCTGLSGTVPDHKIKESGITDVLYKPFMKSEVAVALRNILTERFTL
ncbi:chemotaxis protein CheB [Desulfatiferula olefinivorans]